MQYNNHEIYYTQEQIEKWKPRWEAYKRRKGL